jgi:glyoxylase-like metal-dependent hydrolase (beta-lactamase superfamily II)
MNRTVVPASLLAGVVFACALLASDATAQQVRPQAPGYYRFTVGDFEVTALNDGVVPYETSRILPTATPDQITQRLQEMGLSDPVGMSYNAFLVNTGNKLILIDTGTGGAFASSPMFRGTGRVLDNLRAAGYRPEDVDEIYISHLGPDHIGGLVQGEVRAFPRAILRAARKEVAVFLGRDTTTAPGNSELHRFYRSRFGPYVAAGKFQPFDGDVVLAEGVRSLETNGHTAGHSSYLVESKGERLLVLGDLMFITIQFAEPGLPSAFDADRAAGMAQRQRMLELATREDYLVAAAHLSFPGTGRVRRGTTGYRWLPVNYAIPTTTVPRN